VRTRGGLTPSRALMDKKESRILTPPKGFKTQGRTNQGEEQNVSSSCRRGKDGEILQGSNGRVDIHGGGRLLVTKTDGKEALKENSGRCTS